MEPLHSEHRNRLAETKSPYLLQHAHNPVDWYPWGEEAFQKARQENKPIFLSIGYSTCHWCHVMERESFENEAIAKILNEHFVSIKVDREERPDVDKIYMTATQLMGMGGGWPLSVFLTPELKPFYGGTYFPPVSRYGRIGFPDLLQRITLLWQTNQQELLQSSEQITEHIQHYATLPPDSASLLTPRLIERGAAELKSNYDSRFGGFGGAPKFPRPVALHFLLRHAARNHDIAAQEMVFHTLQMMAAGGMYDQIGGGFSRYSVDEQWLVPHFEKMLYDNAQLISAYVDAIQATDSTELKTQLAWIVRDTITYLLRDMLSPENAFYSAEDADSEGREGAFYVWSPAQIRENLNQEESEIALLHLGITEEGNFQDHSAETKQPPSQNVISQAIPLSEVAKRLQLKPNEVAQKWQTIRQKLLIAREKRPRPHRDDKILTSWNGLLIGALARAGTLLHEPTYVDAAIRAADFFYQQQYDAKNRSLRHSWRKGLYDEIRLLDDYAFLAHGLLELYQATFDFQWVNWARELTDEMIASFGDSEHGGFYMTPPENSQLLVRLKEDYDGAEPSANSVAILNLVKLSRIFDQKEYARWAEKSLQFFASRMEKLPETVPNFLSALDAYLKPPAHLVLAGNPSTTEFQNLKRTSLTRFEPDLILLHADPAFPSEFIASLKTVNGQPTAYYCRNYTCHLPVHNPQQLQEQLNQP